MKKLALLFSFFLLLTNMFSQDTILKKAKQPDVYYQPSVTNDTNKLEELYGHHYLYKRKVYSERQAYTILNQSGNEKIMSLTAQTKKARAWQYIGYLGIPAFIGVIYFEEASISMVYNKNGTTDQRKKSNFETAAALCLLPAIACPTVSLVFRQKHKKCRAQAVKLFNARY